MGLDPIEFYDFIICPTLDQIGMDEPGAAQLLTAGHASAPT
jgi:hypothetical protein